jgi:hypothetical protein
MFQLLCIHFSSMPRSLAGENEDHINVLVVKLQMLKDLLVPSYTISYLLWDIEEHELQGPANKQLWTCKKELGRSKNVRRWRDMW